MTIATFPFYVLTGSNIKGKRSGHMRLATKVNAQVAKANIGNIKFVISCLENARLPINQ